jgi:MerR family transcriptional regulator, Zn(II)-responsive regulator of zntA
VSAVKTPVQTLAPREVARQCGVSADTLRHYERKGLLPRPARDGSGYRRYPSDTVDRVLLVQRALVVGFTLDELARVLRERDRGEPPCRSVRDLVAARLTDLEARLRQLTALRRELRHLLLEWDRTLAATPPGQPAHLLQSLAGRSAIAQAPRLGLVRRRSR